MNWLRRWYYRPPRSMRITRRDRRRNAARPGPHLGSMTDHERGVLYELMGRPRNVDTNDD